MNMVNESGGGFDQYQRSNNILGDGHSNWIDYNKQTVFLDMEQKGNAGYNQGKNERGVQTRSMVNETGGIGYEGVTLDSNIKYRDKQDKVEDQLRGMSNLFVGRHCTNGENV